MGKRFHWMCQNVVENKAQHCSHLITQWTLLNDVVQYTHTHTYTKYYMESCQTAHILDQI